MSWKELLFCIYLFFISLYGIGQTNIQTQPGKEDTVLVNSLLQQSKDRLTDNPALAISLAFQAKSLSDKIDFPKGAATALKNIGLGYRKQGNNLDALENYNQSLKIFEQLKDNASIANLYNNIGVVYYKQGADERALENYLQSLKFSELAGDKFRILIALNNIGGIYYDKKATYDKALEYYLKALALCEELGKKEQLGGIAVNIGSLYFAMQDDTKALLYFDKSLKAYGNSEGSLEVYNALGKLYRREAKYDLALKNHNQALAIARNANDKTAITKSLKGLGDVYKEKGDYKGAIAYYKKAEIQGVEIQALHELKDLYNDMAKAYEKSNDHINAFKYETLYSNVKDTLYDIDTAKNLGSLRFFSDMQKRDDSVLSAKNLGLQKLRFDKFASQNKLRTYLLLSGFAILLIIAVFLYRNNRQKQKAKSKIEQAYSELKDTQQQLIQREKMASLGELTAGIAHEIQNPLNFVNNFSEVSNELIDEMHTEIDSGNTSEIKQIATDIKQNLEKINHHGKRAEAIVKGMLQHSRSNTGEKAPTNINALADEYLRLAYHGLRAKDKSFNATTEKDYDESVGKINIIPQDIGRVILNLITNAFYAVTEKKKKMSEGYEPTVSVSTKKTNGTIEIKVKDNGDGIPQKILDKIFQPFFTTKPTGQGTGLGLSLSYDIVKAHRGELKVETKEGEGAEFIIQLPYN